MIPPNTIKEIKSNHAIININHDKQLNNELDKSLLSNIGYSVVKMRFRLYIIAHHGLFAKDIKREIR